MKTAALARDQTDGRLVLIGVVVATPIDIKYEDIPEETRKQFEAAF